MFKVHHLTISVRDIEKSEKFYSIFGFKRVHFWQADDKSLQIVHLRNAENIILEMFCYASPIDAPIQSKMLESDLPEIGVKHFALSVESLKKSKKELERLGVDIAVDVTKGRTGIDYFFIKDPDGILLEIAQDDRKLQLN